MSPRTCVAALVAAFSVLTLSAGPAAAERVSVDDGAGDVWRWEPTSYAPQDEPAGTQDNVDVTQTAVNHLQRRVRVRVHYASLTTDKEGAWQFELLLGTDTDARYDVALAVNPDNVEGTTTMWKDGESGYRCPAMQHSVDYATDTVTLEIPRICLGRPQWIRFSAQAREASWPQPGTEIDYNDDPGSDGPRTDGLWSDPIHRGSVLPTG
jgi:hypothetical protein